MAFQRRKLAAIGVKAPYLGFIEAGALSQGGAASKGQGECTPCRLGVIRGLTF
jgi:hypothetical protein